MPTSVTLSWDEYQRLLHGPDQLREQLREARTQADAKYENFQKSWFFSHRGLMYTQEAIMRLLDWAQDHQPRALSNIRFCAGLGR